MDREKLESLIIDHIDGKLGESDRQSLEQLLAKDPDAFKLYEQFRKVLGAIDHTSALEPSGKLKENFQSMLREEISRRPAAKQVFFQPTLFRAAAAVALVMAGVAGGYWISNNQQQADRLVKLENEMKQTKREIQDMLENESSASQRLQGVTVALEMPKADDEVVQALVRTMNEDPNSNVRMAAVDALGQFQAEPGVRKALIASLSKQTDPLVQIALIQLMVRMKEKSVIKDLERMVNDDQNMQAVKDEASKGILKLS